MAWQDLTWFGFAWLGLARFAGQPNDNLQQRENFNNCCITRRSQTKHMFRTVERSSASLTPLFHALLPITSFTCVPLFLLLPANAAICRPHCAQRGSFCCCCGFSHGSNCFLGYLCYAHTHSHTHWHTERAQHSCQLVSLWASGAKVSGASFLAALLTFSAAKNF